MGNRNPISNSRGDIKSEEPMQTVNNKKYEISIILLPIRDNSYLFL